MHHFRNTYPTNTNAVSGYLIPDDEDNNTLPLAEINIAALQLTAPTNLSTVSIPYSYRYGFCAKQGEERAVSFAIPRYSGKRQEREQQLNQSVTSAEYWFYDGRLGRRWNIDPKTKKYPDLSPYATFNNNPIFFTDPDGQEPIKPSATSLSGLIKVLNSKNVKSLADLISWYGGIEPPGPMDNVKSNGWLTERYVYSKSWGWIDMRHFSAAAYGTDLLLASSDDILENGEQTEAGQEQAGYPSAWSYEDLVSNALGVYFESYLEDYDGTTLEALESFFKEIGVVENPLEAAPNELPEEERTSPPQNTTYKPKYATHKREKGLNAKIVKFIEEFTGEDISKDRRSKVVDENGKPKGSN